MEIINQIRVFIRNSLSKERYEHSLGVAETAAHLGKKFGIDTDRLEIAALLHDAGKHYDGEERDNFIIDKHILLTPDDLRAKGVIHAKISAVIAREKFQIEDKEILDAVYYHTSGHPDFTRFQKIIFASDYLDPARGLSDRKKLVKLVETDFERGVLEIIKTKIFWVMERNDHLHPLSVEFYNRQTEIVKTI